MHAELTAEVAASETVWPLSRAQYEQMVDVGVFDEDDRVELLEGVLVAMSPQNFPHAGAITRLNRILMRTFGDVADVCVQVPFAAGPRSMPEPDLYLAPLDRPQDRHPDTALLVVEVSDSSQRRDRRLKPRIYAAAAVPEYWIVDVGRQFVEVHSEPLEDRYGTVHVLRPGDRIALVALPGRSVAVAEVFGLAG